MEKGEYILGNNKLDLLKFEYENLHRSVWDCHKAAWQATSIIIPILFTLEGFLIKSYNDLSLFQTIMGIAVTWFLVATWRLMMHMFAYYNKIRYFRLGKIEDEISKIVDDKDLIKYYKILHKKIKKKTLSWSFLYNLIFLLITILNFSLLIFKIKPDLVDIISIAFAQTVISI